MQRKGVCYDVGRVMMGSNWRPVFDPKVVHRELEIIQNDLHCNAVRIQGFDLDRLATAAEDALRQGLEVWFSPEMWDRSPDDTLEYLKEAARTAEKLRERRPDRIVFSVGSEISLFMQGFLPGNNVLERLGHPSLWDTVKIGKHNAAVNAFLHRANDAVRDRFRGKVTYASVGLETIDWSPFDFVGVDLYRDRRSRGIYRDLILRYRRFNKPLANMEFGCCTFRGAEDLGGRGWEIVDWGARPPRLKGEYVYDQASQAREVTDLLRVNDEAGVDATFVFTFVEPGAGLPEGTDRGRLPALAFDLDIVRYSLVKTLPAPRPGATYSDLPWEPKESFRAVADYYGTH